MSLTAKLLLSPVLVTQALLTRARLPRLPEAAGEREGEVGQGPLLRLLMLGDSSAAGVGVARQREALAGYLPAALARQAGVRVRWRLMARSGVNSAQCLAMLEQAGPIEADIAVVVLGVNDVVDQVPSRRAVAAREAIANRLRNAHGVAHVVFAPLPPVHRFPGLPQPLRWVAGADARRHDAAVAAWARTRDDVSHVPIDLPLNAGVMAEDGFHPGPPVYRVCSIALAEHIAEQVWPRVRPAAS
ncbi:MAG: SGNH/GDSL hydrolase family protein [Aquincola sp.]|nr:SGNH/GDSL hydrolase family protein [Aquincola sp.]MDH4287346.1 SGNH/GDSL hydrolase family protein [Aquincola sp.]MDH5328860.1 SGNH/GDSL hydrolase family protein [Aquincola sp.]